MITDESGKRLTPKQAARKLISGGLSRLFADDDSDNEWLAGATPSEKQKIFSQLGRDIGRIERFLRLKEQQK